MPIVRPRSHIAIIGAAVVLVTPAACGSDDAISGAPVTAVATAPQVDQVDSTTTSSTTTAPTTVPATTAPTTTEAPEPDRITRAETEALAAAGLEGAEMLDASAFVAALGETGAFITVDGRYPGRTGADRISRGHVGARQRGTRTSPNSRKRRKASSRSGNECSTMDRSKRSAWSIDATQPATT